LRADIQPVEVFMGYSISMEEDLSPLRSLQEAVSFVWEQAYHESCRLFMRLDGSAPALRELFELPPDGFERSTYDHGQISMEILGSVLNDHFVSGGNRYIDDNTIGIGAFLVAMRPFDGHSARHDGITELLEVGGLFLDQTLDAVGFRNAAVRDSQRKIHWIHLFSYRPH
jgi:hypothetical protein